MTNLREQGWIMKEIGHKSPEDANDMSCNVIRFESDPMNHEQFTS